jgi:hypothetical protein
MLFNKMKNFLSDKKINKKKTQKSKSALVAFYIIISLTCFFTTAKAESVCDHELLIMELKQDLEDNGILDCLRYHIT